MSGSFNWVYGEYNALTHTEDRYVSFYANGSYTFDERYSLTGSIRIDQSNLFGTDPKYQYRPLWSVGGSWQIANEPFMEDCMWLNRLNLRMTYGVGGNVPKDAGPYMTVVDSGYNEWVGDFGSYIQNPPNSQLRWEKTASTNVGIDFSAFNSRLSGSIDYYYKKYEHTPVDAINHAMVRIRGSYALAMMFAEYPDEIYVARKDSPMIIGVSDGNCYVASDVPAILKYTRNVYYIGNMEIGRLADGKAAFYNLDGDEIEKELVEIKWDAEAAEKGGFEHFMMKEIHEQPKAILDTMNSKIKDGRIDLSDVGLSEEDIKGIDQIYIVACGSAYHTGVVTQYVMEDLARVPVRVELASEFRYRNPILNKDDLVIVVSQSGETADTLAGLRLAKEQGVKTMGIVNVVGSSIAREADNVFYTMAGPEISVATTKAYSAQLIAGYLLSVEFARVRGTITEEQYQGYITEMKTLPEKIDKIIEDKERIQWFASKQANARDIFFVGRGIDYAICMEGSLKLKEISYIHSEAYAAGELKHGTISLIEDGILVIGSLTQDSLYEKTISNMVECKSRGASLMGLTNFGNYSIEDTADFVVYVPKTDPHFAASLAVIPLQLLGYYVSVARGLDVDKPRNLAKSVTVE